MSQDSKNVVSIHDFKRKKTLDNEVTNGRKPLYVSHMSGKVKGSPHLRDNEAEDFGDRLGRIRSSLERINRLMADLKKSSDNKTLSSLH